MKKMARHLVPALLILMTVGCDGNLLLAPRSLALAPAVVAAPVFSPGPGIYDADLAVALSTTTDDAVIHYTISTDGTEPPAPTTESQAYSSPLPVAGNGATAWIKAFAAKTGFTDSDTVSGRYTIDHSYPGSITVTLDPPSAQPVTFSGSPASISKGTDMTVTTTFTASSYAWYLDFSAIPSSIGPSYTIVTAGLGFGMHSLALVVVSGGVTYTGSFSFQVTE